jgi:hypothetical protein
MDYEGTLEGVQTYTLHGALWYRAYFTLAGDAETIMQAQLPEDAFDSSLRPGDPLIVTMLLRTVMQIQRRGSSSAG